MKQRQLLPERESLYIRHAISPGHTGIKMNQKCHSEDQKKSLGSCVGLTIPQRKYTSHFKTAFFFSFFSSLNLHQEFKY